MANNSQMIAAGGGGGVGFLGLLTLVLLLLEAFEVISIGWFWVFAPLWIPLVTIFSLGAVLLLLLLIGLVAKALASDKK